MDSPEKDATRIVENLEQIAHDRIKEEARRDVIKISSEFIRPVQL
jgi:hypothetical protein